MAIKEILIKAFDCKCNECSHSWIAQGTETPKTCPACKSSDWDSVWQKFEQSKNTVELSDAAKKRLESNIINQGRILDAMRRERRTIRNGSKPQESTE